MANEIWALAVIAMAIARFRQRQFLNFTGADVQTLLQAAGLVMVGGVLMDAPNPLGDLTNKRRRRN